MFSAFCLDGRAPFLDQQVMEFAAQLPAPLRSRTETLKYLLKKACAVLPRGVSQPAQTGFAGADRGLGTGELRRWPKSSCSVSRHGHAASLTRHTSRCMIDQHLRRSQDHASRIWALMMLEAWCRNLPRSGESAGRPADVHLAQVRSDMSPQAHEVLAQTLNCPPLREPNSSTESWIGDVGAETT